MSRLEYKKATSPDNKSWFSVYRRKSSLLPPYTLLPIRMIPRSYLGMTRTNRKGGSIPAAIWTPPPTIARPDRFVGRQVCVDCGEAGWSWTPLQLAKDHSMSNAGTTSASQGVRAQPQGAPMLEMARVSGLGIAFRRCGR